jgi:hypothetical protein
MTNDSDRLGRAKRIRWNGAQETHLVLKVGFVVELLEVAFLGY